MQQGTQLRIVEGDTLYGGYTAGEDIKEDEWNPVERGIDSDPSSEIDVLGPWSILAVLVSNYSE